MTKHYFSDASEANDQQLSSVEVAVRGLEMDMVTSDSVFSAHRLDLGTKTLLKEVPTPPSNGTFLDLGCGWGPIACVMAAMSPDADVWAVDVNHRALDLTRRNAKKHHLRVHVAEAQAAYNQALADKVRFDLIWSNPPVRIGKDAMRAMLVQWFELLSEQGEAWLVVSKNLGADSLIKWLNENGWDAQKYHSKKGYRIIQVRRGAQS